MALAKSVDIDRLETGIRESIKAVHVRENQEQS